MKKLLVTCSSVMSGPVYGETWPLFAAINKLAINASLQGRRGSNQRWAKCMPHTNALISLNVNGMDGRERMPRLLFVFTEMKIEIEKRPHTV